MLLFHGCYMEGYIGGRLDYHLAGTATLSAVTLTLPNIYPFSLALAHSIFKVLSVAGL